MYDPETTCVSFAGDRRICSGRIAEVAEATKRALDAGESETILIFDAQTSKPVEIDFRGSVEEVLARLQPDAPEASRGPGRPRLGVVGKEVTLLPRHWEWLSSQPGGASVTLRKLVDAARKASVDTDAVRQSRDAAYSFMLSMAGDEPGFEEAVRALYAGRRDEFEALVEVWPCDIRDHTRELASRSFD